MFDLWGCSSSFSSTLGLGSKVRDVRSSMLKFGELFELFESFLGKFWANKTLQKVSNFIIVIQNGLKYGKKCN